MKLRTATIIVGLVDAAAWAFVAFAAFMSGSDAATRGLDEAAGIIVTALSSSRAYPRSRWPCCTGRPSPR
jgi:hypothetical protein